MRKFLVLLMVLLCLGTCSNVVYAEEATLKNDGNPMDKPYGEGGLESSFDDLKYYDCYIPYKLTVEDIGGYSTGATWAKYPQYATPIPEVYKKQIVATQITLENDMFVSNPGSICVTNFANIKREYEAETGMSVLIDGNGAKYYISALPGFCFRSGNEGNNGFEIFSSTAWGTIFDVILTDGTVIHFVMGDSAADQHTNGGVPNPVHFDVIYKCSKLNYEQYKNLFQAQDGHSLEVWGKMRHTNDKAGSQNFVEKYNIGSGEDQNKVAVIRMYNGKIFDNPKRASSVGNDVSCSYGDMKIGKGDSSSETNDGIISEYDLVGMSRDTFLDGYNSIELPKYEDLSAGEKYSMTTVKGNIEEDKSVSIYDNIRVAVVFIGLVTIVYSVLLLFALVFDSVNTILEIELVAIFTLGKLRYSEEGYKSRTPGYIGKKALIIRALVIMAVGFFIISGTLFNWVLDIYYRIVT